MQTYSNAQYIKNPVTGQVTAIRVDIDGTEWFVPIDAANTYYANIMALVSEGTLTILPAE